MQVIEGHTMGQGAELSAAGPIMTRQSGHVSERVFWFVLAALLVSFHLGLIFSGLVSNLVSRPLHMALALPWILVFAAKPGVSRLSGLVLAITGVSACVWIALQHNALSDQYGFLEGNGWIKDISAHTGAFAFSGHFYTTIAPGAQMDR